MNDKKNGSSSGVSLETVLTHGGREPSEQFGFVNTPVYRGSTVLFKTLADIEAQEQRYLYGRAGNPTTEGVEVVVTELEGAFRTRLVPSGPREATTSSTVSGSRSGATGSSDPSGWAAGSSALRAMVASARCDAANWPPVGTPAG